MNRTCFSTNCLNKVAFSCNCKANTFSCVYHIGEHMITKGNHIPTPFIALVDEAKIKEIQEKYIRVHNYYDKLKQNVKIATCGLIKKIEQSYKKLSEKISKRKKMNLDLLNNALLNSTVDIEVMKQIEEIKEYDEDLLEFKLDDQILKIDEVFNIDFDAMNSKPANIDFKTTNSEWLFFNSIGSASNIMNLINLTTLKKTVITLPVSDQYCYCASCDLGEFTYFLYGGAVPAVGSCRLMNIKNSTVTPLPSSSPTCITGACLYNERVYVFGGSPDGGSTSTLTQEFDLKNKAWRSLCALPIASYDTRGSVISAKIYVTGNQLPDVLVFCPVSNSYSSIFKLTPNSYKPLFENWIVTSGGDLYEFSNGNFSKCQSHSHAFDHITSSSSFRRDHFIYFMPMNLKLLRINTTTKSLESVTYSD